VIYEPIRYQEKNEVISSKRKVRSRD